MMDVTRMMQNGTWSGWVEVDGVRHEVQPGAFQGTRDRSWGLRTVGLPDAQPNPAATGFQFFWIWAPMNFENFSIHYFVNQDESGEAWNENGVLVPKYGGGDEVTLKSLSIIRITNRGRGTLAERLSTWPRRTMNFVLS